MRIEEEKREAQRVRQLNFAMEILSVFLIAIGIYLCFMMFKQFYSQDDKWLREQYMY